MGVNDTHGAPRPFLGDPSFALTTMGAICEPNHNTLTFDLQWALRVPTAALCGRGRISSRYEVVLVLTPILPWYGIGLLPFGERKEIRAPGG